MPLYLGYVEEAESIHGNRQLTAWLVQSWSSCQSGSLQGYPLSLHKCMVAIAASHTPLGGMFLGIDLLVSHFPHSALRLRPTRVPVWDSF